jgi:pimeloyl-ACP methyl ester carboxylesterase
MPLASASGRKVYYEIHGEGTGTPLVLVMGMAGSCKGWLALQVPDLAPHHRVLIYENRGVGESEDPGGPFTTADLADDFTFVDESENTKQCGPSRSAYRTACDESAPYSAR